MGSHTDGLLLSILLWKGKSQPDIEQHYSQDQSRQQQPGNPLDDACAAQRGLGLGYAGRCPTRSRMEGGMQPQATTPDATVGPARLEKRDSLKKP